MSRFVLFPILIICTSASAAAVTNLASIAQSGRRLNEGEKPFDIHATCIRPFLTTDGCRLVVLDGDNALPLYRHSPYPESRRLFDRSVKPGDRLHLRGRIVTSTLSGLRLAYYEEAEILSHGRPPEAIEPTGEELSTGEADFHLIRVSGKVVDVFPDEADPNYLHLQIIHDGETLLLPHRIQPPQYTCTRNLIGSDITAVGICEPTTVNSRRHMGRTLTCSSDADIRLARPPSFDIFDQPDIAELDVLQPEQIAKALWHRAEGRVLAAWNGRHLLLRIDDFHITRIDLAEGAPPACGEVIEVAGLPSTDIFHINLTRALWRPTKRKTAPFGQAPIGTSIRQLQTDEQGRRCFASKLHGRPLRVSGFVRRVRTDDIQPTVVLEDEGFVASVNFVGETSAAPAVGSRVAVTGICVMEAENWRPNLVFPQIRDFHLAMRTPDDLAVLAPPPWWTPSRLTLVLGFLLLVLVGTVLWNRILRRIAERRGKELFRERAERFGAVQRMNERTRIAVELHDTLSQSLTGISMELETAARLGTDAPPEMKRHLEVASRTLKSCHTELRRCLWDLRSQALEEISMDKAIKRTLLPVVKANRLDIRFNVRRNQLPDDTTHMVLRVIRELVANAIVHGQADRVKVAGGLDGDRLVFSVRDNGYGFDPDTCPGVLQGHFGLQGIRERLSRFKGTMSVESRPGGGTRVAVVMSLTATPEGVKA